MIKYKWEQFTELKTCENLIDYFKNRAFTHGKYCHYTSLKIIEEILSKKQFFLSCVNRFNDSNDSSQFGDKNNQKYFYSLCFSTGATENLALWYLYGGIKGKGGRIRFSSKKLQTIIKESKFELSKVGKTTKKPYGKRVLLENGVDIKINFHDVIYYENQRDKVRVKYNTMVNKLENSDYNAFALQNGGFSKDIIWYYEKETRLLIELIGKTKTFVENDNSYVIIMKLPKNFNYKWMHVDLAPQICKDAFQTLNEYTTIKECNKINRVHNSVFLGKVNMKLHK